MPRYLGTDDDDHVNGQRHVSELRPATGLLFISQVIYEYVDKWWNDIDRGNFLYVHRALWYSYQRIHLVSTAGVIGEGN
jgi:hypothetical protein